MQVNFQSGLNIITGGSGAGKSIIVKALSLALGARGTTDLLRSNEQQLEVIAHFDISNNSSVISKLKTTDIEIEDDLFIKRIIHSNGRSKAYINDQPASLSLIKSLGEDLISINSQHQTHQLQKRSSQLELLDCYGSHSNLLMTMKSCFESYKELCCQKQELEDLANFNIQLLAYQVKELEEFAPTINEYPAVVTEYNKLANSQDIQETFSSIEYQLYSSDSSMQSNLQKCIGDLNSIASLVPSVDVSLNLLQQCSILIDEVNEEMKLQLTNIDTNPQSYKNLNDRLSLYHSLARKHDIKPENLAQHYLELKEKLEQHNFSKSQVAQLEQDIANKLIDCEDVAKKLHKKRLTAKTKLEQDVLQNLSDLGLEKVKLQIELATTENINANGNTSIEFMLSTNPGQELQPMSKTASGGELARVNLAISSATAKHVNIPVSVFDEIDTGVSGKAAALVGECIYKLGKNNQIICITHHPNVAAQPGTHWHIEKSVHKNITCSKITLLNDKDRQTAIAGLISNENLNTEAIAHAKHLLNN